MKLADRLAARWSQFVIETHMRHSTFQAMLVNLALIDGQLDPACRVEVLVDSWREAGFLRLLGATGILRRCKVKVIRRTEDVPAVLHPPADARTLVLVTGTLFSRYHHLMAPARATAGLLVV